MPLLRFTSCMADNMHAAFAATVGWLGRATGCETAVVLDMPWPERERRFDAGTIDACWICGLPYVRKADELPDAVELLAAPVMASPRYGDRPLYFSDVMVRADSGYRTFADLRGCRWAYNEPQSHSGCNIVRHHLATLGEHNGYFAAAIESGAHQASIRALVDGTVDASAIDTTVFEEACRQDASIALALRAIETIGPSPMPPWVVRTTVPRAMRERLRRALVAMHEDPEGRAILATGSFRRFAAVDDAGYDPIRRMDASARTVQLAWHSGAPGAAC